ncbi:MAG TPA: glycosyltransferase [Candidatus Binatia bacterium]|nr:glycosyltransferase [Candidatus Binatia bacterium]
MATKDSSPHFLFVAIGSHGDVLPVITLAKWLRSRNNRVTVIGPPAYSSFLEKKEIGFAALATKAGYETGMRSLGLLNHRYRMLFLLRHALGGWLAH